MLERISLSGFGQIAAWNNNSLSGVTAGSINATTNDGNLNTSVLSRGSGITATSLGGGYASSGWNVSTEALAVSGNKYYQATINAASGFQVSLSTLDWKVRNTSTGAQTVIWAYSTDGSNFTDIGSPISLGTTPSGGTVQAQISLSGISALQNVPNSTTITFRLYGWGASASTGTLAFGTGNVNSLAFGGTTGSAGATPALSVTASSLAFGNQAVTTNSTSKVDSLSGTNLTGFPDSILITSPSSDYQVSRDNTNWGSTAKIGFGSATLVKTPFYVRFTPQTSGPHPGNITFSGGGATTPPTVSLTGNGTDPLAPILYAVTASTYTQDFSGLPSAGNYTINGNGPFYLADTPVVASGVRGWQYGAFGTMRFIVSDGSGASPTGGTYSYGNSSDRALGSFASGSNQSFYGAIITNTTSDILRNVTISFTGEQWHRGNGLANTLAFSYKLGASSIADTPLTAVSALNFTSPVTTGSNVGLDGNAGANRTVISPQTFILNDNWMPGQNLMIRWFDADDGSSDDGLAVDDFSFTATPPAAPTRQDSTITFSSVSTFSLTANWLNGNGAGRIVIMNTTNSFTNPTDGTTPSANANYSGSGQQVIYNGTGSTVNVTGLTPGTTYHLRVFAYNGSGASTKYSTASAPGNPNSQATVAGTPPTHLIVTSVNGGVTPFTGGPFYVVVQSLDASNFPQNVIVNTNLSVTMPSGSGTLGGTLTGTLTAGTHIDTIFGITNNLQQNGVVLRITATSGDALGFADTPPFDIAAAATNLTFSTVPNAIVNTTLSSFTVLALTDDQILDENYVGNVTLTIYSGPVGGDATGTLTRAAVGGVATFDDIQFDLAGNYVLQADAQDLMTGYSNEFVITNPPVLTELVVPKYIGSKTSGSANSNRTAIAVCLRIDNLFPGVTYDLRAGLDTVNAPPTSYGVGNTWGGTAFNTTTLQNVFTANGSGSSGPFWIYIEPTGNSDRYAGGQVHNLRIGFVADGGLTPSSPDFVGSKTITSLDIQNTPTAATSDDGAFLKGSAISCAGGKYILIYDNVAGTGDPLFAYQARQAIPTDTTSGNTISLPTAIRDIYRQSGSSAVGDWPAVIPTGANNPNGVRRIEARNPDNTFFSAATDADGIWPSGANTTTIGRFGLITLTTNDASLSTVAITGTSSTPASCVGTNNGTATVTATGNGTLTYAWNTAPVQTTATATGLAAGSYTVTVTDASGCTATASVMVNQPATSTIVAGGPTTFCAGGSVNLSVASGATSYSWASSPPGFSSTLSSVIVNTSGSYTVTVTTGACTQTSFPVVVTVNPFAYNGTIFSESMGQPAGSTQPLVNNYTGWQNSAPIVFSSTSSTQADVRKSNPFLANPGVSDSGNVFFSSSGARNFIISGINTLGYSNFLLTFELKRDQGTTADPFEVEVSSDGTNYTPLSFTQPSNTSYKLDTATGAIPATANLRIRFSKSGSTSSYRLDDVKLAGSTNSVIISANGPTTICSGQHVLLTSNILTGNTWSPGNETTHTISATSSGTYSVTATGTNGCTATSSPVAVTVNPLPATPDITVVQPTCINGGSITVTSPLGAGLSYSIDSIDYSNTSGSFTNVSPGTYGVTVKNTNGCISFAAIAILATPTPVTIDLSVTPISCIGAHDGSITATPLTGTGPFTYAWDTAQGAPFVVTHVVKDATHPFFNVGSPHGFAIDDVQGKEITLDRGHEYTFFIDPSSAGHPFHIATDPEGGTFNNEVFSGESPSGGVDNGILLFTPDENHTSPLYYACGVHQFMGYIINIVDAPTTPTISGLGPGTYTVTVTDANGCTATASVTLTDPANACSSSDTLHLKAFLEGPLELGPSPGLMLSTVYDLYTNSIGNNDDPTAYDTITVNLWYPDVDSLALPDPGHSVRVVLHNNGTATCVFPQDVIGNSYYIAVKTRTAIETWSRNPLLFTAPSVSYDFSSGLAQAYEDGLNPPMKVMGGITAFYSGDINQDGGIDGNDMNDIDNNPGGFGYDISDINGDMGTDGNDMNYPDNNGRLGLFYARPF